MTEEETYMKYIAYGSNMIEEQMAYRCPDARLIGVGYLPDHQLEFYLHATVERSRIKDGRSSAPNHVPVAVWEISAADEQRLDRYEGYPSYYIKEERIVRIADGSEIRGMIYLMHAKHNSPPSEGYYEGIRSAYEVLGLHCEIQTVLEPALRRSFARRNR